MTKYRLPYTSFRLTDRRQTTDEITTTNSFLLMQTSQQTFMLMRLSHNITTRYIGVAVHNFNGV